MTDDVHAPDWPNRPAVSWLNYKGDQRHLVTDQTVLGPNMYGEAFHPVAAAYDAETNRTRVGGSPIAPPPGPEPVNHPGYPTVDTVRVP